MSLRWLQKALNISRVAERIMMLQCQDCSAVQQIDRTWVKGPAEKIPGASHGLCPGCKEERDRRLEAWKKKRGKGK